MGRCLILYKSCLRLNLAGKSLVIIEEIRHNLNLIDILVYPFLLTAARLKIHKFRYY
jgi:hypothetical protein